MRRKQKETGKFCPLLEERCKGDECALFHEKCDNCVLQLIAYNTFKLNTYADRFFTEKLGEL